MESALETRVMRKITWRIVPFIMLLYFVAFIDRVNIGFAALTMNKDLGLRPGDLRLRRRHLLHRLLPVRGALEPRSLDKVGARLWIARVMITWGLISGRDGLRAGADQLLRPALPARRRRGRLLPRHHPLSQLLVPGDEPRRRDRLFMAAAPISTALGSPVSGALLEMDGLFGLHGWQWMFLIEAMPARSARRRRALLHDRPARRRRSGSTDDERDWLVDDDERRARRQGQGRGASHSILARA